NGAIYFDESYTGNVVVYCGCVGLLPFDKFRKDAKAGDALVLAGGKTGRDGVHGVTFASAELTEKSETVSRPAVQIANPVEEEKLKRAIVQVRDLGLASGITDLGGGGLSSAVGETANKYGCGAVVDLDKVLKIFGGEDVEATVIGRLIQGGLLRLDYKGERVADVGISFLFKPPRI